MRRPLLFYAAWPLGYHNRVGERVATELAHAGYDLVYVAGVGIRNPRLSSLPKLLDRGARKLRAGLPRVSDAEAGGPSSPDGLRQGAVLVAPPRQYAAMRRLNAGWLERQLESQLGRPREALIWIRWPTPELVDAIASLRPAGIIYAPFDAYEVTPGITGRWRMIFESAEAELVRRADVVVVPGERLGERYRAAGTDVRVVPPGVDLVPWRGRVPRGDRSAVIGFIGTIDFRLSVPVLRAVATAHPEWRVRLIGALQSGFDPGAAADLPNITIEPAIPPEQVPSMVASFDLGLMPYVDDQLTAHMVPVKNLEYLAAGIPAVARRITALEPFAEHLYFADTPEQFVAQLERALAEDTPALAERRRRAAEPYSWPAQMAKMVAIAGELGGPAI